MEGFSKQNETKTDFLRHHLQSAHLVLKFEISKKSGKNDGNHFSLETEYGRKIESQGPAQSYNLSMSPKVQSKSPL